MEYLLGLIFLVVREIFRRYLVIFVIGTIVVSLAIGGISVYAGGAFWLAAKFAGYACLALGVLAVIITTFSALGRH